MIEKQQYLTPKPGTLIRYNGSFNLDKWYSEAKKWYKELNYIFNEKYYKESIKPEGNEIEIQFFGERKIDEYARFHINVVVWMTNIKKIDKGMYMGNFKANLISYFELDYKNKLQTNPLKKFLFFVYNNFVIRNKIKDSYEDRLYDETLLLENLMKKNLGLI